MRGARKSIQKKHPKMPDRRGRHTKASRQAARAERIKYQIKPANCRECGSGPQFKRECEDGSGTVCTQCGIITHEPLLQHSFKQLDHCTILPAKSAPYAHRNYISERISQYMDKEPRFTDQEVYDIVCIHGLFRAHYGSEWDPENLTKPHIAEILKTLSKHVPGSRYHVRLERWLQAINLLGGRITSDWQIAYKLRIMFDAIAETFAARSHFKTKKQGNIPRIDIIALLCLYSISDEALIENGWYFLNKDIVLRTPSSKKNWRRAVDLLEETNKRYTNKSHINKKISIVRPETMQLFGQHGFLFKSASLTTLTNMSYRDNKGLGLKTLKKYYSVLCNKHFLK